MIRARAADAGRRPGPARDLQQAVHHARRDDGLLLPDPVDPGDARQLPDPDDDRREGPGVPAHQPAQLVHLHDRRRCSRLVAMLTGGVDTGWTFYTPYSTTCSNTHVIAGGARHLHHRLLVDPDRPELHRHDPPHARARADLVPAAAVRLGALRDQPDHDPRHAGDRDHGAAGRGRARAAPRHLRSGARRRPGPLPAPVLVLLAPGGLHHDPAGDGRDQRADRGFSRKNIFGYAFVAFSSLAIAVSASWSGATTCSSAASRSTPAWSSRSSASSSRSRRRSRSSTGRRRSTRARSRATRRCSTPSASSACSRSAA